MNAFSLNSAALNCLRQVAEFTPEYEGSDVPAAVREPVERLLAEYPRLARHADYVEFLRSTGGAHFDNDIWSFGIYGFGGYVVPSFEERLFVDKERFFLFGEILYYANDAEVFLFFDLPGNDETVWFCRSPGAGYRVCAASFRDLLRKICEGLYPGVDE